MKSLSQLTQEAEEFAANVRQWREKALADVYDELLVTRAHDVAWNAYVSVHDMLESFLRARPAPGPGRCQYANLLHLTTGYYRDIVQDERMLAGIMEAAHQQSQRRQAALANAVADRHAS